MKRIFYYFILLTVSFIMGCSKGKVITPVKKDTIPTPTTLDLLRDSVYSFTAEDNLWNTAIPTYAVFNPRSFTGSSDIAALQTELDKLSQYAINPATNQPYEYDASSPGSAKYSFIDDGSVGTSLGGTNGDFGFSLIYNDVNDLRIIYVYPGSPAGLSGVKRGYQITAINNNTNISYDAKGYGTGTSTNLNFVSNAVFNSNTITLTLKKPDNSSINVTLNTKNYTVNPILKDTVYNLGNGHILGYMVFNSFTSPANSKSLLDAAFSYFVTQGVTDLAVDLRYDGGGYVATAEYLDNLIVPKAKSGTLMYNTYFNSNFLNGTYPLFKQKFGTFDFSVSANAVNFLKAGSLDIKRVFFIISSRTASASELTINNLRPEMDVQLVGTTSYGKPVGFFGIPIGKYYLYTPEFSTKNSAGQGDYYAGFTPGTTSYPGIKDYDDPTKDFGDPTEGQLAHILKYVSTGSYAFAPVSNQNVNLKARSFALQQGAQTSLELNHSKFNGMILDKNTLKRK